MSRGAIRTEREFLSTGFWPHGLSREKAAADLWLKEVAPATDLPRWFAHDPARCVAFQCRYPAELKRTLTPLLF
jgi:uncharacterized protein YeaO (DUF488 family)